MSQADILFEVRGRLGLITLNRPKALNALTTEMCVALRGQLGKWAGDKAIDAVVIQGAGDRAFCAGGDVVALYESGKAGTADWREFFASEYRADAAVYHFPKPYIALIDGITMGGGVGVSVHGSHRIATERTVFAMPETGLGLFPDVGGSYFLPRLPGQTGMYLGLTGYRAKAADAIHLGVANGYVPSERLEALAARLASVQLPNAKAVDAIVGEFAADPGDPPVAAHRALIDRFFTGPGVEAILMQLLAHGSDWARAQHDTLLRMSPTSLKVAFRQLSEGAGLEFDDCMRMEFRMINRVMAGHDFYEGVRAIIIDKDKTPRWQPAGLEDVSAADVDAYFAGLDELELDLRT